VTLVTADARACPLPHRPNADRGPGDFLHARANRLEPWPGDVGGGGLLTWTDGARCSPSLSEALQPFTARLRPQRGPN
jgi:hypothetical protein